jgi:hypothetical protein
MFATSQITLKKIFLNSLTLENELVLLSEIEHERIVLFNPTILPLSKSSRKPLSCVQLKTRKIIFIIVFACIMKNQISINNRLMNSLVSLHSKRNKPHQHAFKLNKTHQHNVK